MMTLVPVEEMVLIRFQTVPFVIAAICELLHTSHPRAGGQFGPFLLSTTLEPNTSFATVRRLVYLRPNICSSQPELRGRGRRPLHCGISTRLMSALGHKQSFTPSLGHVRFAPESGHPSAQSACPLSARSGHMQCGKIY